MNATAFRSRTAATGVVTVELAIVVVLLFTLIFGVLEIARAIYLLNTLQEVTRRTAGEAALTDFRNGTALDAVRRAAIFRQGPGTLPLGAPVTDQHVLIDYLAETRQSDGTLALNPIAPSDMPSCPARNKQNCMADPHSPSCIRFVRVRICQPGSDSECQPVPYQTLVSLIKLPILLPRSTTIVPAESLGFQLGSPPCG